MWSEPALFNLTFAAFAAVLGALVGSFANVVIYRLPRGKSIVFPGSRCPHCGHRLGPLELVPVLSWLALRGRCRACYRPISARYPLVEGLTALGFGLIALRWPPLEQGAAALPLLAVFAMLVMLALIDIDTFTLPDSLTLPATAVALAGALLYPADSTLPTLTGALVGAAVAAGAITLINRLGGLVLRRFADTRERLWPLGFDQVNLAALGGALGGWRVGLLVAAASLLANGVTRRALRLPEPLVYALWLAALVLSAAAWLVPPATALAGSLIAAGATAMAGALFWWFRELAAGPDESRGVAAEDDDEPVAMGFGDAKLAAVLGALLGWEKVLVMLFLSFLLGALGGLAGRAAGRGRVIPFGPYLALAGLLALFFGNDILAWYLGLLGV